MKKRNNTATQEGRAAPIHACIGVALIILSLICSFVIPYNIAPEFSGRSLMTVQFDEATDHLTLSQATAELPFAVAVEGGEDSPYRFTAKSLTDTEYASLRQALTDNVGTFTVEEYQSFSPSISRELVRKAIIAVIIAALGIIAYVSFVFRNTSPIMASWKYGTAAVAALIHDVALPFGVFAVLSPFTTAAIDTLFITAILATLGYSVNDTIVIFDRIRDRLRTNRSNDVKESFEKSVRYGVRTSVRRSIYTSLSTVMPLFLLFITVPTMKWFGLTLFIGVIAGTYSSLFFGPSLLVLWHRHFPQAQRKEKKKTDTERAEDALRRMLHDGDTI